MFLLGSKYVSAMRRLSELAGNTSWYLSSRTGYLGSVIGGALVLFSVTFFAWSRTFVFFFCGVFTTGSLTTASLVIIESHLGISFSHFNIISFPFDQRGHTNQAAMLAQ